MFIRCSNDDLKHSLQSLTAEISHLTRISNIIFKDNQSKFDPVYCLHSKISNVCEVILKFKEPIEREFLTEMFTKKLVKLEKKQQVLQNSISKIKINDSEIDKRKQEVMLILY